MHSNTGGWLVGAAALLASSGCAFAQVAADNCASAPTITAAGSYSGTTVGGTVDGSALCGSNASADAWFRFVAPASGQFRFDTCHANTNFDTTIAVKTACSGGSQLACNDDAVAGFCPGNPEVSRAFATLSTGQVVFIRIAGALANTTGTFVLNVTTPAIPPPPTAGPDVSVLALTDVGRFGTGDSNGIAVTAYAVGTESCNRGDTPVAWYDAPGPSENRHPVIGQNMYRLKSAGQFSRFEQLGQSWLKHGFVSVNGNSCGSCIQPPDGGDQLGVNCSDPYGSGLNGSHGSLGSRSRVNASTGFYANPVIRGNSTGGTAVRGRLQVPTADVVGQPAGTRFFVDGQYVTADDAQHVRPAQTVATNAMNNATWHEINIQNGTGTPNFISTARQFEPGIFAWRLADPAVTLVSADHDDVPNPSAQFPGTFIRSRFWVAAKVTDLGDGQFRYEYAVFNLNSDRSAASFSVPLPDDAQESSYSFHHPMSHSGEPYSNAPWTMTKVGDQLQFATVPFATDANANAIRWGTLYNFGFTVGVAPTVGTATIGLFKPGTAGAPDTVAVPNLPVPTMPPACLADFNNDGNRDPDDLADFITCFFLDVQFPGICGEADFNGDGFRDPDDLADFITVFFTSNC